MRFCNDRQYTKHPSFGIIVSSKLTGEFPGLENPATIVAPHESDLQIGEID